MSDESSTIIQGYLKRMQDEYENFNAVYNDLLTKLNLAQTEYTKQDDQFKKLLTDETNLVTIYSSSTRQNFDTEFEKVQSAAQAKILNISQVPEELDEFIKLANLDLEGVRNQLNEISQNVSAIKDEANAQIDSINRELPKVTEAGQKAIEDMNKVVNQVTASGQTLQQQINELDLRLSGIVNNQSNISKDITAIQETNKAINASQEALLKLIDKTDDRIDQINQQIGDIVKIRTDIDTLKINKADKAFVDAQLAQTSKQLEGLEVNVSTVGVYPDGNDYTSKLRALISTEVTPVFPAGRYKISDELLFKHGQGIRCVGHVILDGSEFVGTNGGAVVKVTNEGDNYTPLPSLEHDLSKGDRELTFNSPHNLSSGDIICLYDNTDFSWSSSRNYYKKGEYARVSSVIDDTKILLDNDILDDYTVIGNIEFGVYKMNMGTFSLVGDLEIIQGKEAVNTYGLHMERVRDFKMAGNVTAKAKGCYASVCYEQCFNCDFQGTTIQNGASGGNLDYGLAIVNSQHITARGYFVSSRHGVTHTGKNGIGAIVNRDCKTYGTVKSTGVSQVTVCAFDAHGNSENISFEGTVYGGVNVRGSSMKIRGTVYGNKYGICASFSEVKSFNHDISNTKFITHLNPYELATMRGVIDFGSIATSEADFMLGGLMNLSNIDVVAPNAKYGVVFRTRNINTLPSESLDISLQGARIQVDAGNGKDAIALWVAPFSAENKPFRVLNGTGCLYKTDRNIISSVSQLIEPIAIA